MWERVHAHAYASVCALVIHLWKPEEYVGGLPLLLSALLPWPGLSINQNLTAAARLTSQ